MKFHAAKIKVHHIENAFIHVGEATRYYHNIHIYAPERYEPEVKALTGVKLEAARKIANHMNERHGDNYYLVTFDRRAFIVSNESKIETFDSMAIITHHAEHTHDLDRMLPHELAQALLGDDVEPDPAVEISPREAMAAGLATALSLGDMDDALKWALKDAEEAALKDAEEKAAKRSLSMVGTVDDNDPETEYVALPTMTFPGKTGVATPNGNRDGANLLVQKGRELSFEPGSDLRVEPMSDESIAVISKETGGKFNPRFVIRTEGVLTEKVNSHYQNIMVGKVALMVEDDKLPPARGKWVAKSPVDSLGLKRNLGYRKGPPDDRANHEVATLFA